MKCGVAIISAFAAVIGIVIMPVLASDVASAQSSGRKGADTVQKCYADNGKPVRCDRLGAVNQKIKANKDKTK